MDVEKKERLLCVGGVLDGAAVEVSADCSGVIVQAGPEFEVTSASGETLTVREIPRGMYEYKKQRINTLLVLAVPGSDGEKLIKALLKQTNLQRH